MRPLSAAEIVDLRRYGSLRRAYVEAVIAHKRKRRMSVGERVTLLFEDRETLRFQVQEMLWIERIVEPRRVQAELDVYNALMPDRRELSATLFIEIPELPEIRPELDRLVGIDDSVALVLGGGADEAVAPARFDMSQLEEDRISAVHYLRFPLSDDQAARLCDTRARAAIRIDHPNYHCEVELPEPVRESLGAELEAEPTPLLIAPPPEALPPDEALFETGRVRALRPAQPLVRGEIIVEPIEPVASLLDADAELLAELMEAVKRAAEELVETHGACRVATRVGNGSERLRWHVHPLTD